MSQFIFQRIDDQTYNQNLEKEYHKHIEETGKGFFEGQMDEALESNEKGDPIRISAEDLEDNEDELIRLMHLKFLEGKDTAFFNYDDVDFNESYDD